MVDGPYTQGERDRAAGCGCVGIMAIAFGVAIVAAIWLAVALSTPAAW